MDPSPQSDPATSEMALSPQKWIWGRPSTYKAMRGMRGRERMTKEVCGAATIAGNSTRGQGLEVNQGVEKVGEGQMLAGRTSKRVAAVRGPGEGTVDQRTEDEEVSHTNVAPSEIPATPSKPTPHERTRHDTSSSGEGQGVAGSHRQAADNEREARDADEEARHAEMPRHETAAPLSTPLKGEQDSQVTSSNTRANGEGTEPPDDTTEGGAHSQRHANSTRTGQRHGVSAHGEGCCTRAESPSSM
ncbi:hypothetical protein BU15DRAFT_67971 [Melanogaster broomeanus]|nr:hypothetical protein BU15DRAFT_67971 [Melanogaster broomeanus]